MSSLSDQDRALLLSDPVVFTAYFSGYTLQDFHCDLLTTIDTHKRSVILLPAGHGKSSLAVWYIIFKIAQNRNVRIIWLMKNEEEIKQYARQLRSELSNNHRLIDAFGRFQPRGRDIVWSNDAIEVMGRQITAPMPTVFFASSSTIEQALGKRVDIFIADDIVTPNTVSTQAQRDKQWSIFNEGVETGPQYLWDKDRNGRLMVPEGIDWPAGVEYEQGVLLGTVFHPDDLFHRKIEGRGVKIADMESGKVYEKVKDPTYCALKYDCWADKARTKTIWPGRWSEKALKDKEKSIGTIEFNRRYRNIAIDEGMTVFRKSWIFGGMDGSIEYPGCLDKYRSFGETDFARKDGKPFERPYTILGLDPSTGRKGQGTTFSSFVVMKVDIAEDPMRRYVMDVFRAQLGYDDILSYLLDGDIARGIEGFWSKYRYNEARVESNAAQAYLINNKRVESLALHGCRVVPHQTNKGNKYDDEVGVQSMQPVFKNGLVSIPFQTPNDQEIANDYIDQLLTFPVGLFDYAMANWFIECGLRALGSKFKSWGPERGPRIINRSYVR